MPATLTRAWQVAATVLDPELPVVTIEDLGILRDVTEYEGARVHVQITPTYSGCPAMETIRTDLIDALCTGRLRPRRRRVRAVPAVDHRLDHRRGPRQARGRTASRRPDPAPGRSQLVLGVRCPQCGSLDTRESSRFGSTACKALWVCQTCREPFDHFKPL